MTEAGNKGKRCSSEKPSPAKILKIVSKPYSKSFRILLTIERKNRIMRNESIEPPQKKVNKVWYSRRRKCIRENKTKQTCFPFWYVKTETKSVRQGYAGKSWEWRNGWFNKGWVSWIVINGNRNQNLSVLKEVLSDGRSRGNSPRRFQSFWRSSGRSVYPLERRTKQQYGAPAQAESAKF